MGKLNIAHHKSYHPYRADNIERVRRDEEEARLKEERDEGRMIMADAEARLDLLRQRSGPSSSSKKRAARLEDEANMRRIADGTQGLTRVSEPTPEIASIIASSGHINLFDSLESSLSGQQLQLIDKKQRELAAQKEAEKGAPLAPSAHDLTPWYADRELKGGAERDMEKDDRANDQKRRKQMNAKSKSDPLRDMKAHLAKRAEVLSSNTSATFKAPSYPNSRPSTSELTQDPSEGDPARGARIARESSERARAEALKARRKRELAAGSMTPSSVAGTPRTEYDYRDVFNVKETREAKEARDRGRARHWGSRGWDEDGSGDRERTRDRDRGSNRERRVGWRS